MRRWRAHAPPAVTVSSASRLAPSAVLFLVVRLQLSDHRRIGQRRRIAERLALGDVAEQAAHDLAGAGLGQVGGEQDVVWPRNRADLLDDMFLQVVDERL